MAAAHKKRENAMPDLQDFKNDWNEVVQLEPKGYCEIQNRELGLVFHGPVEKIEIDTEDMVNIHLKWIATMPLQDQPGFGEWSKYPDQNQVLSFPNFLAEFVIEPTPEKGPRIRFGTTNIIYLEPTPESDKRILAAIS